MDNPQKTVNVNNVEIRQATSEDAYTIREIQKLSWLSAYVNEELGITEEDIESRNFLSEESINKARESLAKEGSTCFIAYTDNKALGYVWPGIFDNQHRVGSIYILPEYQGMGIGSKLIQKVFELHSGEKIFTQVVSYNTKAIAFYKKWGFVETGKTLDHPIPNVKSLPIIEMSKDA